MGSGLLNWPIVVIVVKQIYLSRQKLTQISHFFIKIHVLQNEFQSEIFENLDVDNQMLGTFGSYEPFSSP